MNLAETAVAEEAAPPWRLLLPGTGGALLLDPATGLPSALELPQTAGAVPLALTSAVSLLVGGGEERALAGGLDYPGSEMLTGPTVRTTQPFVRSDRGVGDVALGEGPSGHGEVRVVADLSSWTLTSSYRTGSELPRARISYELARREDDTRPLRNVELELTLHLDEQSAWLLHAPGNRLAPGTSLADLRAELAVSPAAGSLGSPGLVALSRRDGSCCVVLWPFSRSEVGWITLAPVPGGVRLRVTTNLAGDPPAGEVLAYAGLNLDVLDAGWEEVRRRVRPALASLGVASPGEKPAWARSAAIYEVQVGRSVFSGGWSYEPYPRLEDVTADLGRIAALGFDTVQLMPRQPYPSYNVHDYDDTATTYGGDEALGAMVSRAHEIGLRVVLDIVLHGVLDRRSVRTALRRVEQSGILDEPAPAVGDVFADTPESRAALTRAWCQHIADFAPYWIEGSPEVHPLTQSHPGWFCRDSSGELTGIYTEAFDLADEDWQRWFCERALGLIERYAIDGFRFDAPTYNNFANWSASRRARASASTLGCVSLFARLRQAIKAAYPDVLMFTEPSGVVLRESMDLNYNYDELWLVPALTAPGGDPAFLRNGAQLAAWLDERDATLPDGALTAHHLDSHDTFWWPAPGQKWRREQIGLPAARALTWCLALCGGPFLMFTGGESGMETDVARTLALRRERRELGDGETDYAAVAVDTEAVFAAVRHDGDTGTLVLVNLSPDPASASASLCGGWRVERFEDLYATEPAAAALRPAGGAQAALQADLAPYGIALVALAR